MITAHVKLVRRKSNESKDGTSPIYLRHHLGSNKFIQTGYRVTYQHWDDKKCVVKRAHPSHKQINIGLKAIILKAERLIVAEPQITAEKMKSLLFNKHSEQGTTFNHFCWSLVEIKKETWAKATYDANVSHCRNLDRYNPSLSVIQDGEEFVADYTKWCKEVRGNKHNSIVKNLKFLLQVLKYYVKKGKIPKNFLEDNIESSHEVMPKCLTNENLQKLEDYYDELKPSSTKEILGQFLFCCYCGLRFKDMVELTWLDIKDNAIVVTMGKSRQKKFVSIPLSKKAKSYMPEMPKDKEQLVFASYSNQKTNDRLRTIAEDMNIKSRLTFHVARHTFGTKGVNKGIPLDVMQVLMGHTNISTTQIYAKVSQATTRRYINLFDD